MSIRLIIFGYCVFLTSACLPFSIKKKTEACSQNGECEGLSSAVFGRMPPAPTMQDSTDTKTEDSVKFEDGPNGTLTLTSRQRKQCRDIYTISDVYVLPKTKVRRGAPWLFGGASLASSGLVLQTRDKVTIGYSALGSGVLMIGYGIYSNHLEKNTRIAYVHDVKGDYSPCEDWRIAPNQEVNILLPSPSGSEKDFVSTTIETDKNGLYVLNNQLKGALNIIPNDVITVQMANGERVNSKTPEVLKSAEWICDVLGGFESITIPSDDPETWEIRFKFADSVFAVPWMQHDGRDFFTHYKDEIKKCDTKIRTSLSRLARQNASDNPSHTRNIQRVIRSATKVRSRTSSSQSKTSGGEKYSLEEAQNTLPPLSENTTIVLGRAQNVAGAYRCTSGPRKANLNIRQDGNFVLMVELDTGTAYGICSDQACGIQGISGTAMAFTRGLKRFRIRQDGENVIINENINCIPRRRK